MNTLFWLHLIFVMFFLSIPFWNLQYLRYGIYGPFVLSTIWFVFGGCPLTQLQKELNDETFSQILIKPFYPEVTKEESTRVSHYILLCVTVIAAWRLCPSIRF